MPKKQIFQEDAENTDDNALLTTLVKKILAQSEPKKPKQKRVITDERREQLKLQLMKGREKSQQTRSKATKIIKENAVKDQEIKQKEASRIASSLDLEMKSAKEKAIESTNENETKERRILQNKIDDLVTQVKDLTATQKEHFEYKKSKRVAKPVEPIDEPIFTKKAEQSKPTKPANVAPVAPPPSKFPSYYYVPVPKNNTLI